MYEHRHSERVVMSASKVPVPSPPNPDMNLWARIQQAINATVVSRADAEWQWPTCHRKNCHQDHGDIDYVFRMFAKQVAKSIHTELLCRAISEPEEDC